MTSCNDIKHIEQKYENYRKSIIDEINYLNNIDKPLCIHGFNCYRKNIDHLNSFYHINKDKHYENIKNNQYETARIFTDSVIKKYNHCLDDFGKLFEFLRSIKTSIVPSTIPGYINKYYLPDLPNFAILISIIKYKEYYIKLYDITSLCNFIGYMEQEGITGEYDYIIQLNNFKIDFKFQFNDIYIKLNNFLDNSIYKDYNFSKSASDTNRFYLSNSIVKEIYLNCSELSEYSTIEDHIKRYIHKSKSRSRNSLITGPKSIINKDTHKTSKIRGGKIRHKTKKIIKVPIRYLPKYLSSDDKKKQRKMLNKSRKLYKKGIYYNRKKLNSYKSKKSQHIINAERIYNIDNLSINNKLEKATGCSKNGLTKILKKGQGAYYSSGSRPNQTATGWGYARLGSAITGAKSAIYDYNILKNNCTKSSKALKLANKAFKKYKNSRVKKIKIY